MQSHTSKLLTTSARAKVPGADRLPRSRCRGLADPTTGLTCPKAEPGILFRRQAPVGGGLAAFAIDTRSQAFSCTTILARSMNGERRASRVPRVFGQIARAVGTARLLLTRADTD
jgi:hypothetical protein